ncbi:MAG: D-sedoheptulose 7-phosphate isomerase [Pseudomonadota bacterium]
MSNDSIRQEISESITVRQAILADDALVEQLAEAAEVCVAAYRRGNKILLAGNGGSAADAQHLAAEFVNRYAIERPGLSAIALTTDTSVLTSIANDCGYEDVFARQLEANGAEGDVFIAITTSGNSPNILAALKEANKVGIKTIGLAGATGGAMQQYCDYCLRVPSERVSRVQEAHIMLGHIICGLVESAVFSGAE